jgi:diguanylate cyclase (GGDEF)-like protein
MSRSRQPIPGYAAVLISLLPAALVFGLQLLAITVLADVPVAAALFIEAAGWMLTSAVVLAFWGAARMRTHIHDLQLRLERALTDPVTGLAVRRVAEDAIVAAGPGVLLTVALADIDRLHDINHGPGGHATGDRYLAEAGRRLRQVAAGGDLVARLGGDEFVLITGRTPQQLADSLTAAFAEPTAVAAGIRSLQVSVGICRLPGGDPHPLLGCADLAMLTAKKLRTRIEIYDAARDGRPLPAGVRPGTRRRSGEQPAANPAERVLMPNMTIIDRDKLMTLIVAYGDARENGRGAADAYGDIDGVLDNPAAGVGTLAAVINDAYAYRLGEASSLDDPALEPIDAEYATAYADLARRLGIQLHA